MNDAASSSSAVVPFEQRYEMHRHAWCDGSHAGWFALDRLLGREVIVNMPYRPADAGRLLELARRRAHFRHAHFVPIYDVGETKDGMPFFTEPYIKAEDLGQLLRDRAADAGDNTLFRLVGYLLDTCKAVAFLHANGFLHLALSPGHVRVTDPFGEVFVTLGLLSQFPARTPREQASEEMAGRYLGAPGYSAPETLDPERFGVQDVSTDVYGLGGILFEILYGIPPNGRSALESSHELCKAVVGRNGPPERGTLCAAAARWPGVADKLAAVCLRALESDRAKRQASVTAFATEIEASLMGCAGEAPSRPAPSRARKLIDFLLRGYFSKGKAQAS